MAKVVQLRGARPGGWAKERWNWIGAVMADGSLTMAARLVAVSLAQGFANHETAECRPGLAALMTAVAASRATVLRALADLQSHGWIERRGGNAPGKVAAYVFRNPGEAPEQVSPVRPEQVSSARPEQVSSLRPEQVSSVSGTGLNPATPPIPPYKDQPQLNHKYARQNPPSARAAIRGLEMPQCATRLVVPGSAEAERWDDWLARAGFPALDRIGRQRNGRWLMPISTAPDPGDEIPYRIALGWAEWLRSKA